MTNFARVLLAAIAITPFAYASASENSVSSPVTSMPADPEEMEIGEGYVEEETPENNFKVFFGGAYFGLGTASSHGHGTTGLVKDVGILNAVGLGYNFGDRNRISLGLGYQARFLSLKSKYYFATDETDATVVLPWPSEASKTSSGMTIHTLQFPLLYAKGFGSKFWAYGGVVMDWNVYCSYNRSYRQGNTTYAETTNGLKQNKLTFDALLGLQYKPFGIYVRYSPARIFKKDFGPNIDNAWTVGLSIGF